MHNEQSTSNTWEDAVRKLCADPNQRDLAAACYFDSPLVDAARRYAASPEWKSLSEHLPAPPGDAIDLGAGNGILSYALAKHGWNVWAVEPDPSTFVGAGAIQSLVRSERLPIKVIEAYGEALPLSNACADLVLARQVLHHARDLRTLCREVSRVLKSGGIFVAMRDHVIDRPADLARFLQEHPLHRLYGGENAFTLNEYRTCIRAAGLELVTVLRPHYTALNQGVRGTDWVREKLRNWTNTQLGEWASPLTTNIAIITALLWAASWLDRRPGRMFSFVCRKPHL